jgi:uroporphyrinogen-III synthase
LKAQIFISKSLDELPLLEKFCNEMGSSLHAEPLIRFEALSFIIDGDPDIVCFTSPRSVWYYFQNPIRSKKIVYACVGPSTAKKVSELGHTVAFVGGSPGDPQRTSKEFTAWTGDRTVLFPESDRSLGSLSKGLHPKQVIRIAVYKTVHHPQKIPVQDIYVFTSPSNAESFLELNDVPRDTHVIAWGKSTEGLLLTKNIYVDKTLTSASETELVSYLEGFLTSQ